MSFTTIDLFAGVGGLTVGLSKARYKSIPIFDVRLLVDNDKDAARTFLMNDNSRKYLVRDITTVTAAELLKAAGLKKGQLDVLVGGPPCQGFSAAGKRVLDDPKNALVKQFLELAIELQPKLILMENVPQVRNWNEGQFWEEMDELLKSWNYDSDCQVLSAVDFGVPQLRRRAILAAFHGDEELLASLQFPKPKGNPIHKAKQTIPEEEEAASLAASASGYITVEEAIGDLPELDSGKTESSYSREPYTQYQKARRGHCKYLFNHAARGHSQAFLEKKVKKIEPGKSNQSLPSRQRFERENDKQDYFSQAYGRLHPKQVAQTITTHFMNPGSGRFTHYRDHRSITVREAARLQSFDDSFVFHGDMIDQQRQVGNAVPPLMARGIGEHFGGKLMAKRGREPQPHAASRK